MKIQGYIIYRIFYGDSLVYVGRTKQPLQSRIHGHLFAKPMHRTICIEQVSRIEYAELQTEADMNLYEIYYILKWHPLLNVDDKTQDFPTVDLPDLEWKAFSTPIWDKWMQEIMAADAEAARVSRRIRELFEHKAVIRKKYRDGYITENEMYKLLDENQVEYDELRKKLYG